MNGHFVEALLAIEAEDDELLRRLLQGHPGLANHFIDNRPRKYSLLERAVDAANISAARVLLENGAHATPHSLATAVVVRESVEMCQLLLDHGVPVDGKLVNSQGDNTNATQLPSRQEGGEREDANEDMVDPKRGATFLQGAIIKKNAKIVRCLIEAGADVNARVLSDVEDMEHDCSILAMATYFYSPDVFDELLKDSTGMDTNVPVYTGSSSTHLHLAVHIRTGNGYVIKRLLEKGANPGTLDDLGRTPFQLACEKGRLDCIYELFRGNPADYLAMVRAIDAPATRASRKRCRNDCDD